MKACSKHEQAYEDSCPWCEPAEPCDLGLIQPYDPAASTAPEDAPSDNLTDWGYAFYPGSWMEWSERYNVQRTEAMRGAYEEHCLRVAALIKRVETAQDLARFSPEPMPVASDANCIALAEAYDRLADERGLAEINYLALCEAMSEVFESEKC